MVNLCRKIAYSENFQSFILFLILLTSMQMGLETIPQFAEEFSDLFEFLFYFTQGVFVFEICVRLIAFFPKISKFFDSTWNTFDFTIVALSLIPTVGSFALVIRLLRIIRVLRVLSISDRLRGFSRRLADSLDEVTYATLIAFIFGYIFSICGYYLFVEIDPERWGTLGRSALSVFYLMLAQNVPQYVNIALISSGWFIVYFLLFYICFISLFISVLSAAICQNSKESK